MEELQHQDDELQQVFNNLQQGTLPSHDDLSLNLPITPSWVVCFTVLANNLESAREQLMRENHSGRFAGHQPKASMRIWHRDSGGQECTPMFMPTARAVLSMHIMEVLVGDNELH